MKINIHGCIQVLSPCPQGKYQYNSFGTYSFVVCTFFELKILCIYAFFPVINASKTEILIWELKYPFRFNTEPIENPNNMFQISTQSVNIEIENPKTIILIMKIKK